MFSLLCGMYSIITEKQEFKILMVGLEESGKTTFLEQVKRVYNSSYNPMKYPKYMPTIGLNIGRFETSNKKVLLWDLGGQQNLRQIWSKYYKDADALIYVIDVTASDERIKESKKAFEKACRGIHSTCPILLIANHIDNAEQSQIEFINDVFQQDPLIQGSQPSPDLRVQKLFPVSSFSGEGVESAIKWIVEQL